MQTVHVIESHTGGEPTRVVVSGGPDLGRGAMAERRAIFRDRFDSFCSAVVNEPRGSDVLVGAFYNMAYTASATITPLGDNIQMENAAYPYNPPGYVATRKQHHSPNDPAWLGVAGNIAWDSTSTDDGTNCYKVQGCADRTVHLHNQVGNYLFVDGHVKSRRMTTMKEWTASSE